MRRGRLTPIAIFFWSLVLVTFAIALRWGGAVGLMFFLPTLIGGIALLAKWSFL